MGKSLEARAVIEALRLGVVSHGVVRHLNCGREADLRALMQTIESSPGGSTQVIVGGYGVGKSHLCEVLSLKLQQLGYAVARLEMGASHGRAENPQAVVRAIEAALSVRVCGRRFAGAREIAALVRAIRSPNAVPYYDREFVLEAHQQFPGPDGLFARYQFLREVVPKRLAAQGFLAWPEFSLAACVPSPMTAGNYAVAAMNGLAHDLHELGVPGLVILFDEAERSEWAYTLHRQMCAWNLMLGFGLAAANRPTFHLKHYRNESWPPYRPAEPSLMHVVFAFTHAGGIAREIVRQMGWVCQINLAPWKAAERSGIQDQVMSVYREAYGSDFALTSDDRRRIDRLASGEDVRTLIRATVSALDTQRLAQRQRLHA